MKKSCLILALFVSGFAAQAQTAEERFNALPENKKEELRDSTVVVLVVCLILSAFVFVVDESVNYALRKILESL